MKLHFRLMLLGSLLLAGAFGFIACTPQAAPTIVKTEAPVVATSAPTTAAIPVLEIVGSAGSKSLTMDELKALPATEGYAGIKSSTGKITPPVMVKGVALKDLAKLIGGMDATTGFNVVAEDGYSITYSFDQLQNGSFIAYDPATGVELKNPVPLTAILVYEVDGKPLDAKQDGTLRLAIVSSKLDQVTDGHWAVKWVNKIEVKSLGAEWALQLDGALSKPTDRASIESCGAPQCHGTTWTDDKAQKWVGVPLYLFVGSVDDEIEHEGPAFNDKLADAGYSVDVIASDGYTATFDAARVKRNKNIIVAYKVNENQLPEEFFPLRLVGSDLSKKEMVGMISQIKVGVKPLPVTAEPVATKAPAAFESTAAGNLVITGLVNKETGFTEADLRAWYIRFASNHLALAYNADSKYADEINARNWTEIISRPDVKIGIADPRFDASGYRALMAFALAEIANKNYGLFGPMFDGQFTFPVTIFRGDELTTITVPEVLETKSTSHIVLRGASIQLIALLESGDLDYAFEYESVIQQHGLKMVGLPAEVNLGEQGDAEFYKQVQVNLDFRRFATVKPQFRGERIGYGITVPANAPHPDAAAQFIAFLLSPEGRSLMEADHHPMFETFIADGYENLPENLQAITAKQ